MVSISHCLLLSALNGLILEPGDAVNTKTTLLISLHWVQAAT